MTAKPGQIALRKFDHDDARVRYASGETLTALAHRYGVSLTAVKRVVDPVTNLRMAEAQLLRLEKMRKPCLGGCGRLVWQHGRQASGYCPTCHGLRIRKATHGTEHYYLRRKCRCELCRAASAAARRERRAKAKVKAA